MPFTETVTIINNSGKIISTGKQLFGLLKDAKAAYEEKKAALLPGSSSTKYAPEPVPRALPRAQTFNVIGGPSRQLLPEPTGQRRSSHDDLRSSTSSRRSHRNSRRGSGQSHHGDRDREVSYYDRNHTTSAAGPSRSRGIPQGPGSVALTETNLRALTEVSATAPSAVVPRAYRAPYATSAAREMTVSRSEFAPPRRMSTMPMDAMTTRDSTPISTPRQSMAVQRTRSDPALREQELALARQLDREIDPHLAYGDVPPDLASRTDLDPAGMARTSESKAKNLVGRIEGLLVEAQCVGHSATTMISSLQQNPERAAAVALALAELSAILAKLSPGFLGIVQGGSPAVFALLASPQFLIGAGVAVGVTVVMFGGWKIVKRIREERRREAELKAAIAAGQGGFEMQPAVDGPYPYYPPGGHPGLGAAYDRQRIQGTGHSVDEALVLDEELSTIETWRRGISPWAVDGMAPALGDDQSADLELISPEAHRRRNDEATTVVRPDDSISRAGRTERSAKTSKSRRTHHEGSGKSKGKDKERRDRSRSRSRSKERHRDRDSHHDRDRDRDRDIPERRSSRGFRDGDSETGSRHSGSRSESGRTSAKRSERTAVKAIEDGRTRRDDIDDDITELVMRPKKDRSPSMLKSLFKKKKDKEDRATVTVA